MKKISAGGDAKTVQSPLYNCREAAAYLRVSIATLDRMVRQAELPSVLLRGRKFRREDLDRYIASRVVGGNAK